MPRRGIKFALALALIACSSSKGPVGTATNPVAVCEKANDVCRYDGSQLGVCMMVAADAPKAVCSDAGACFSCAPQH